MSARHNNTRNFAAFRLSLKRAGPVMQKGGGAYQTKDIGKLWATIAYEGSHVKALRLSLAKSSNNEVK